MLELKTVTKQFNNHKAVDAISFQISSGEVVGFLGPNGAGKSTTMRMIAGILEPDRGDILFDGKNIRADLVGFQKKLGFLAENNPLYDDMLVNDYLSYIADLRGLKKTVKRESIERSVFLTGLGAMFYRPVSDLSKGYRQRVGLAQAIMHHPEILILDEPTEGLDPNQRLDIRALIRELGKDHTVMLSTHVLQEVSLSCDRVIIIDNGKIIADAPVNEIGGALSQERTIFLKAEGFADISSLKNIEGVLSVEQISSENNIIDYKINTLREKEIRPLLFETAKLNDWRVWELYEKTRTIEDIFHKLTLENKTE